MRKLFTLCLLIVSLSASAQWQQTGSKVRYVNGLGIPTRDTAAGVLADSSQILIRPADSSLYVKYKRTWLRVGGSGFSGSGTTNYIAKFTGASAIGNSQIFDNGTKIGINTTSPIGRVSIVGSAVSSILDFNTDATRCEIQSYNVPLALNRQGNNTLLNEVGGFVGIGTASPGGRLHVSEAASGGVPTIQVQSTTTQGGQVWFRNGSTSSTGFIVGLLGNTSGDGVIYHQDAKNITFYTTALERMRITSGGNTLIGTTTDNGTDRLQVSGSMNVSTLATTNNLSVTTNATVGGTLRVTGTTTLGTLNAGAINGSSIDVGTGNGTFGNVYSGGLVQMLGVNVKYRNISATYTATTADDYFINITSGTFTLNLPTAATPYGQVYVIKNSGTGTVTVDPNGTQTIDGATTFTMNVQNQSITIIGDGSNWKIVSKYL